MRLTQGLQRAALVHADGPGTSHAGTTRNWAELRSRIARLAGALRVGRDDRVAILGFNSDRYFEAMYAIPWAGAIAVPLNTRLAVPELAAQLADCGAGLLLHDTAFAGPARALAAALPRIRLVCLDDGGWDALAEGPETGDAERGGADAAGIFYTGGTTGRAKGVVLSHANLIHNVLNLSPHFRFGRETRCLHASPMFHIADALSIFGVTLHCGHHFFVPKFDAADVLGRIEADRITYLALVPTMLKLLVEQPGLETRDLASLTRIFYGGSAMPEAVARRMAAAFPRVQFHQGYGLTETSPTITHLGPEDHAPTSPAARIRSAGQPVFTVDVSIRDESGRALASGQIGEICARGPTIMQRYWENPAATARRFRRLVPHRRCRPDRRRRLSPRHRPGQGHDHFGRREHLFRRGRERPAAASRRARMRRDRPGRRGLGRACPCRGAAPAGRGSHRRGIAGPLPRRPRPLQMPAQLPAVAGPAAVVGRGQNSEGRTETPGRFHGEHQSSFRRKPKPRVSVLPVATPLPWIRLSPG
jgi:long-chain acyl-CoA synthetase